MVPAPEGIRGPEGEGGDGRVRIKFWKFGGSGKFRKFGKLRLRKNQVLCLLGGAVLCGLYLLSHGSGDPGLLAREGYGGGEREYRLSVTGLLGEDQETELRVKVAPREYTEAEAEEVFWALMEELPERILGENENLQQVERDLDLIRAAEEQGIRITWYPEDTELISYDGRVHNESLGESVDTGLKAVLSDGSHSASFFLELRVQPRSLKGEERILAAFRKLLTEEDRRQINGEALRLPDSFEGRELSYGMPLSYEAFLFLLLGAGGAVLLPLRERSAGAAARKKREEALLLDHSELLSKLMVYLGAGLTIRGAWQRIAESYQAARKAGLREERPVYEEMLRTLRDMSGGVPEGKAYRDFGQRCRLRPYVKLCALLEQNRKNGGADLRALLSAEMEAAFEERKNAARRRGEEAGTKLLLPLFLMLLVVMVIVILPAMLSMG